MSALNSYCLRLKKFKQHLLLKELVVRRRNPLNHMICHRRSDRTRVKSAMWPKERLLLTWSHPTN